MILSGMSDMEQMSDNIQTFSGGTPLRDEEVRLLEKIADGLAQMIPCTGCRYCCDGCPAQLDIPGLLSMLNDARFSTSTFTVAMRLEAIPQDKWPTACIGCGACAGICPQHIQVPELMREFSGLLDKLPSWKKICQERAEAARKLKS